MSGVHASKDEDVHILDGSVAEHHSRGEQSDEHDAIRSLGRKAGRRTQGRGGGVLSRQAVNGYRNDDVQGDRKALEPDERGNEVFGGILHLCQNAGETNIASIRIADAQTGTYTLTKRWVSNDADLSVEDVRGVGGVCNTQTDHHRENRGEDGNSRGHTDTGDKFESAREAKYPTADGRHRHKGDGTGSVFAHCIQTDRHGDSSRRAGEHNID